MSQRVKQVWVVEPHPDCLGQRSESPLSAQRSSGCALAAVNLEFGCGLNRGRTGPHVAQNRSPCTGACLNRLLLTAAQMT
jgi:hypothetical protein